MPRPFLKTAAIAAVTLAATACERRTPEQPTAPTTAPATEAKSAPAAPDPRPIQTGSPRPAASPVPARLDTAALDDRQDPARLLRYYAAALAARDWTAAAKAWGANSGVTAKTLKESYDRAEAPQLTVGKGITEGAAGSLYHEVPATLRFGSGPPEHGSLVLRRVNDVDGATAEQLRWHIERSTIGQGQ